MLLLLLACAPHGSLGRDNLAGSESSAAASTSSASTTTAGVETTAGDADGTSHATTESSSDGTSGSSDTTHAAESSTTAADACAPLADDDACSMCRKSHCCDESAACAGDEVCSCIDGCIADGGDAVACETMHCAGPNDAWTHLHQCISTMCVGIC